MFLLTIAADDRQPENGGGREVGGFRVHRNDGKKLRLPLGPRGS